MPEGHALFYEEVSKSRKLIRAQIRGENSTLANRIMMSLIAQIDYEHPKWEQFYTVNLADIANASQVEIKHALAKQVCEAMISTAAGLSECQGKRLVWVTFFSKITYENGVISAKFNNEIHPVLSHLKDFVTFNYLDYMRLNSNYAQQLWELLTMLKKSGVDVRDVDLPMLQDKLGIPAKIRKPFQKTQYILDRAKKEIERKTYMRFVWEPDAPRAPKKIKFYLGATRIPKKIEQEKAKLEEQSEKTRAAQNEWANCVKQHPNGCEHYAKSKLKKCAICRKMQPFAPSDQEPGLFN